jgi:hypothetical protein
MMIDSEAPNLENWLELYNEAIAFRKLAPWLWMYDSDLFGVMDPVTGEIGYCIVMGNLGEFFALGIYLGTKGLQSYYNLQDSDIEEDITAMTSQQMLMASYEDRGYLNNSDLKIIKELGLKFRGRNEWPLFRKHSPGYAPWYINQAESIFMKHALEQARYVATEYRAGKLELNKYKYDKIYVRIPKQTNNGIVWRSNWLEPEPIADDEHKVLPMFDEIRLTKAKKRAKYIPEVSIEFGYFYSPISFQDNKKMRPYFPINVVVADCHTGTVLMHQLFPPNEIDLNLVGVFFDWIEKSEIIPGRIIVSQEETYRFLQPVTANLDIELILSEELENVKQLQEVIYELF